MSETIRFPLIKGIGGQPTEVSQIITLMNAVTVFPKGGEATYTSVLPWHIGANSTEAPFACVVIEFSATAEETLGDGTNPICLFGEIDLKTNPATSKRELLGILGVNITGTDVPVIPIIQQAGGDFVGVAQPVSNIACYDALSIGGLTGDITFSEGVTVTVTARPIRRRDWVG